MLKIQLGVADKHAMWPLHGIVALANMSACYATLVAPQYPAVNNTFDAHSLFILTFSA